MSLNSCSSKYNTWREMAYFRSMFSWRRWLSYILPIPVQQMDSPFQKGLEISWQNGRLVLDGPQANFSYGSLHHVMQFALSKIPKSHWSSCQKVLLLGVGGGSAVELLRNTCRYFGPITAIDIDPQMPEICHTYFNGPHWDLVQWIIGDAQKLTPQIGATYDLIIVDLFVDIEVPNFVYETSFLIELKKKMNPNSYIIFNSIAKSKVSLSKLSQLISFWQNSAQFSCNIYPHVAQHNTLILVQHLP